MGIWYKEDLEWIVNNPDGDWMQNSCNTKKNALSNSQKQGEDLI